jgi:hypothetical protein
LQEARILIVEGDSILAMETEGRALSGHRTAQAYRGYAKETMQRALAATRKRHAHLLAHRQLEEQSGTEFPNGGRNPFPNGPEKPRGSKAVSVNNSRSLSAGWGARIRTWEWRNQNPPFIVIAQQVKAIS